MGNLVRVHWYIGIEARLALVPSLTGEMDGAQGKNASLDARTARTLVRYGSSRRLSPPEYIVV